jgi:hypothetical protein
MQIALRGFSRVIAILKIDIPKKPPVTSNEDSISQ